MIMSIDQSLSASGVILWDAGSVHEFTVIKTPTGVEVIRRIRSITIALRELILRHKVTAIVVESLPFGLNSTSVRPLAALYYCIQNLCIDLEIKFHESHVTKVKKLATGKGSAKKAEMMEATLEAAPEWYGAVTAAGYKKTTGLADLCDSYWIYKLYEKGLDD